MTSEDAASPKAVRWNGLTVSDVRNYERTMLPRNPRLRSNSGALRSVYNQQKRERQGLAISELQTTALEDSTLAAPSQPARPLSEKHEERVSKPEHYDEDSTDAAARSWPHNALTSEGAWREWYAPPESDTTQSTQSLAVHWAAEKGMQHILGQLLRRGEDAQVLDACGRTPLTLAASFGQVESAETMLEHGVPVDAADAKCRTALHVAAAVGSVPLVELLFRYNARVGVRTHKSVTAAMIAAGGGHSRVLTAMIEQTKDDCNSYGGLLNQTDEQQMDALMWACRAGANGASCVQILLNRGVAPSRVDYRGRSTVAWAVIGGHESTVKQLCNAGADLDKEEWVGEFAGAVPVLLAAFCGHAGCLEILLEHGGDPTARCWDGCCALTALALGLQRSGGSRRDSAAFVGCIRVLVPALLLTMASRDELEVWMAASGITAEEINQMLGGARMSTSVRTLNPVPQYDDALLSRMESLLVQADVAAWEVRRRPPPLRTMRAVVIIQKHVRKSLARVAINRQRRAVIFIQRCFRRYQAKLKEAARWVVYGPETEPPEHYFRRVGSRRGIDVKLTTAALQTLMGQWESLDKRTLQQALWRWRHNASASILQRQREQYHSVINARRTLGEVTKQVRFAGMKLRHGLVRQREHQQMFKIKLELLHDQLEDQYGQIHDLGDIHQSISRCRHRLNSTYQDVELAERVNTQVLVQYTGTDAVSSGLHIEERVVQDDTGQDFTNTEIDALKISDASVVERALLDSEANIARGQQLMRDGEYRDAQAAFEAGCRCSTKAELLKKMLGKDLHNPAKNIGPAVRLRGNAAQRQNIDGQARNVPSSEPHAGVDLWQSVGTRVALNNILTADMKQHASPQKTNDLTTRDGLVDELFHLRSTAEHLQILSAFQFRHSAKELVDTAAVLSKDIENIRSYNGKVRSAFITEDNEAQEPASKNPAESDRPEYNIEQTTVIVGGLPSREEMDSTKNDHRRVSKQLRELMSSYFGAVLSVTIRQRAQSKSWALISFAMTESRDALMSLTSGGLMLTWPPTANNGTLLYFSVLEESKAINSGGAFGQTWKKHKSAVRTARVALNSFLERTAGSVTADTRLLDRQHERARLKNLRDEYLAELDSLSSIDVNIREAMLAEHEAKMHVQKMAADQVFYYMTLLKQLAFFGNAPVSEQTYKDLVMQMEIVKYQQGAVIIQEGTVSTACFVLLEGRVSASKEGHLLNIRYTDGAFFGELGLRFNENRSASITADSSCKCLRIQKHTFHTFLMSGADTHRDLQKRHMEYLEENRSTQVATSQSQESDLSSDDDEHAFVTRVSVAAAKAGLKRSKPDITTEQLHEYVHQGIWGVPDEHHTMKKRWSRNLQHQKLSVDNGMHVYDDKAEFPLADFMENLMACINQRYEEVAVPKDEGQLSKMPKDWLKMSAVHKVDGVAREDPEDDIHAHTVWIGGIPAEVAKKPIELKKSLGWFGNVQSISVRAKPGYCKSWALVTFVESDSAKMMFGYAGKQFRLDHIDKGYASLVFKPNKASDRLKSSRQQGVLASILASHRRLNADAGAVEGWRDNTSCSNQPHSSRSLPRSIVTRDPADYLVRKKSSFRYMPDSNKGNSSSPIDKQIEPGQNNHSICHPYRDEFAEPQLVYTPGKGYHSMHPVSDDRWKPTDDVPPTRGHPRRSIILEPKPKRSVLDGAAVVQDGRVFIVDSVEEHVEPEPPRGKQWVVGPASKGWVRDSTSAVEASRKPSEYDVPSDPDVIVTTHVHRGIASGMFAAVVTKGAAKRWLTAFKDRRAGRVASQSLGTGLINTPRPPLHNRPVVGASPAQSPRAQKQATAVTREASTQRDKRPLSAPAWRPHSAKSMNAGWRHKSKQYQMEATVKGRVPSPAGVSPPTSPPCRQHRGHYISHEKPLVFSRAWRNQPNKK